MAKIIKKLIKMHQFYNNILLDYILFDKSQFAIHSNDLSHFRVIMISECVT